MKKLLAAVLVLAMATGMTACGSGGNSSDSGSSGGDTDKPYAGTKIVYAGESGSAFGEFYKSVTPEFTEQTGISVEFFEVAHANTHDRFLTEAMAGTGSIDVYQLDQPWIPEFASMGFLEEVPDEIKEEINLDDFSESGLSTMSYEDTLYGIPFQYHTPVIFYRTDLFEAAGLEAPPATWDEYREYAKILTDEENGIYGTCLEAAAVLEPVTHFLDKIVQAGGNYWDVETGEVTFDSPEVKSALQWMYDIQNVDKSSPEGALGYENGDVYNLFLEGRVAMVSEWPYFYAGAQDPEQSTIVGKVGIAPQPKGAEETSALWAFGYGVASASKNKEAAWEFCVWGTSTDILTRFSIDQATPNPRASAMTAIWESSDVDDDLKNVLSVIDDACLKAQNVTTTPYFPAVQERLSLTLSNVMSGINGLDEEVAATAKDLEGILSGS